MSVMVGPVDIQCDECGRWTEDASQHTAAGTRRVLKSRGWVVNVLNPDPEDVRQRSDYCPECAKALGLVKP